MLIKTVPRTGGPSVAPAGHLGVSTHSWNARLVP